MFGIGIPELIVILIIGLIVLGPKKLPGLTKALGKGIREFNRAIHGLDTDDSLSDSHSDSHSDGDQKDPGK